MNLSVSSVAHYRIVIFNLRTFSLRTFVCVCEEGRKVNRAETEATKLLDRPVTLKICIEYLEIMIFAG